MTNREDLEPVSTARQGDRLFRRRRRPRKALRTALRGVLRLIRSRTGG